METFIDLRTGVRMEYVERGEPGGRPVIFLHGVTDSWHSFERVLPLLPPTLRAFAISQRGHGDSSRPESGYRFADLSADLLAFMDAMRLPRAVIVGHSMGASVAQRFVIDHADRVAAVVLMAAFVSMDRDQVIRTFYATDIAPLTDPIAADFVRAWQSSTLANPMDPDHFETIVHETLKVPAHVWRTAFKGFLETPDFADELRGVSAPALLQWGDRDAYTLRAAQDRLLAVIPGARLITYEGHGHGLHWEDPSLTTGDLVTFVTSTVT